MGTIFFYFSFFFILHFQQTFCKNGKEMKPSSNMDLNPMDYFVWGYLEGGTKRRTHNKKTSLITSIKKEMAPMDREMFMPCEHKVINAEEDYIDKFFRGRPHLSYFLMLSLICTLLLASSNNKENIILEFIIMIYARLMNTWCWC